MTLFTLYFDRTFDKQAFKEQFMTGFAAILDDAIWHKLSLHDSSQKRVGKDTENKPDFLVIHNMLW